MPSIRKPKIITQRVFFLPFRFIFNLVSIVFYYKTKRPYFGRPFLMEGTKRRLPTFTGLPRYHRPWSLSLLSSEWNQVGQLQYSRLLVPSIRKPKMRAGIIWLISTPWLNPLPGLHLGPINRLILPEPKEASSWGGLPA